VVDELKVTAPARVVRVGHVGEEDARWDPDRIAQVVSNLVGNALQHGSADAPIVVESRIEVDQATLSVTNHGAPIPSEALPHLFEPFVRATSAPASTSSVGLGLFIAREVVSAHGGTLEVTSSQVEGTRFTVRMPRFTPTPST
jgi:sigma-B regulation protein RsbU (phosphoserine phosphatase)